MNDRKPTVGLIQRLVALVYDGLLLFAVLFFFSIPVVVLFEIQYGTMTYFFYLAYIHAIAFLYFAWFWVRGGQTLAMKTWHIFLVSSTHEPVSWAMATRRLLAILLFWLPALIFTQLQYQDGMKALAFIPLLVDYLWCAFNPGRLALHDVLSATQLVKRPRVAAEEGRSAN